ncbi:MAG: TonB-dependent receptor [Prevotella sp.]|nr:TonB-dependent receptor [Prevotella sp.]
MKKLLMMASLISALSAQGAEPMDTTKVVNLQEVQVVSTRATKKTPMAYTNVGQEDLKAVNHGQDIPYLISLTPSVTMTSDAGNGIGYTSLRVRGTDPSRINITANGIPMNDAESSSLYWVNMGDFASSVKSMQIQRGVGTSTNGAGAFGATLNMLTENVGAKPFVGVDLSAGSYYSHKETLRFGTGLLGGHWGIQGRLSNIGSKGYIDRASTKLNSYLVQAGYFGENTVVKFITWNGEEQTYHAWNYTSKYEQAKFGRTFNSCGVMGYDDNGNPTGYYSNQTDNYHQQNYQLIWNERLTRELNLNAALHYTKGQGYYEQYKRGRKWNEYGLSTETIKSDLIQKKLMDNDFYGAVASLVYDNKTDIEASFGGGWNKYDGDHFGRVVWTGTPNAAVTSMPAADFEYYRNRAKKTDFNVYGKINYTIVDGLNAFADLQYRHVGVRMQDPGDYYGANATGEYVIDKKYEFFNPKFGLNYDITPNHRVYASYAIAHKEPVRNNFEELPLDEIRAERLNDLEVGYKYQNEQFSAGANIYWMNYKDQFVLTGELNKNGEGKTQNVDKSYRLGVELEAAWQPVEWFRWDVNGTWSKNRVKEIRVLLDDYTTTVTLKDKPLSFSPDFIFNNIFTFTYKGFRGAIQSQYVSDQYLTNTGFKDMLCKDENGNDCYETLLLKHHFTTNIDLSYNFSLKKLGLQDATIGATLYNIFSAKFDNNGWAAPQYQQTASGEVIAVNTWDVRDGLDSTKGQAAGFAPSAPFNMMVHLSVNF